MNSMDETALATVPASETLRSCAVDAFEAAVDAEVRSAVPVGFGIESRESANWLVRKIVSAREYSARVKEWAAREARRAEREEATLTYLYGRQLEAWVKDEIEKLAGRRKSFVLPAGTVGFRTVNPALQVDDEDIVLGWAQRHCPPAVVVVEKISRTTLKQHFESTGELPDGAHVEPGSERFFVR